MKKWLIPLSLTATCIAAMTPMLVACNKNEQEESFWIAWDYKEQERYKNKKVSPLPYDDETNVVTEGRKWIAKNKNNIAYDFMFAENVLFDYKDEGFDVTINKMNLSIKINSYNSQTRAADFEIKIDFDSRLVVVPGYIDETDITQLQLTLKNIKFDIHQDENSKIWYWCTHIDLSYDYDRPAIKDFLASEASGNWSITGSYYLYSKLNEQIQEYQDDACNYSKANLDEIYADENNKWMGLFLCYNILGHPMYYLKNYQPQPQP